MSSPLPHKLVYDEITAVTTFLVEHGLCDDQNYPALRIHSGDRYLVEFPRNSPFSNVLRSQPYSALYEAERATRAFNALMLDGGILQLSYEFQSRTLVRHRLAYLPAPDLTPYHEDPEIYMEDNIYSEVVDPGVVTVPLRFDYDARGGVSKNLHHPMSHLTIGQYQNCRIAATAGLTPVLFVEFVLRSFYNTAHLQLVDQFPARTLVLARSIASAEEDAVHIGVPHRVA